MQYFDTIMNAIEELINTLSQSMQGAFIVLVIAAVIIAVVQCFFGYRIFKIVLGIVGFATGAVLIYMLVHYVFSGSLPFLLLGALAGGVAGALLLLSLYNVGVFLMGVLLIGILGVAFSGFTVPNPIVILILAIAMGVVSLIFQRFSIIISTAFGSAWIAVTGTGYLLGEKGAISSYGLQGAALYTTIGIWILLGIAGVIVQYKLLPKETEERR